MWQRCGEGCCHAFSSSALAQASFGLPTTMSVAGYDEMNDVASGTQQWILLYLYVILVTDYRAIIIARIYLFIGPSPCRGGTPHAAIVLDSHAVHRIEHRALALHHASTAMFPRLNSIYKPDL